MKKLLILSIITMSILLLTGCSANIQSWSAPGGLHVHWEGYRSANPALLVGHYGGWENIGYLDEAKPRKKIWTLLDEETCFRISVGHPPKFSGHVFQVLASVNDQEPIKAVKKGSDYYFWCWTKHGPLNKPGFRNLPVGIYPITVEVCWTTHKGPYYKGPVTTDTVTAIYGQFRVDPFYSP